MTDSRNPDDRMAGDARDQLVDALYTELRALASSYLRHERVNHTLQPTALVHEAYMRIAAQRNLEQTTPRYMVAAAARIMRHILIDSARAKKGAQRGGSWRRITLSGLDFGDSQIDFLELDDALAKLEQKDPELGSIVELRFFGGLTLEETAAELGISEASVTRGWRFARAFLARELGTGE